MGESARASFKIGVHLAAYGILLGASVHGGLIIGYLLIRFGGLRINLLIRFGGDWTLFMLTSLVRLYG